MSVGEARGDHFGRSCACANCACNCWRQRIRDIANRKHIRDARFLLRADDDIAALVQLQLSRDQVGIRFPTNSDRHALHGHFERFDGPAAFNLHGFDAITSDDASNSRFRKHGEAAIRVKLFGELAARAHLLAAMDQRHGRTNFSEQQSVFRRSIAAADNADVFTGKLLAIARATLYQTPSLKLSFAGNAQSPAPQTGSDDDRDRLQLLAALKLNALRFQINAFKLDIRPEIKVRSLRLRDKTVSQLAAVRGAHAQIIFYGPVNGKKLPADFFRSLQHQRVEAQLVTPTRR